MNETEIETRRLELAAKHGEVRAVVTPCGVAFFRKPTRPEWKQAAQQGIMDQAVLKMNDAAENLSRRCVVEPSKDDFAKWFDDKPAIAMLFAGPLIEMAGLVAVESAGKSAT